MLLLVGVGFVAGFVDSIAGGGGLHALPSLLLAGLDHVSALATNKLQGTFGTASATHTFWKKGLLRPAEHMAEIACVFVGAALGVIAAAGAVWFDPGLKADAWAIFITSGCAGLAGAMGTRGLDVLTEWLSRRAK